MVNLVVRSTKVPIAERSNPMIRSPSVRLKSTLEGRVWLRSPCDSIAYWECPPGPLGVPWLLIEICAWSLVTDVSDGCSVGVGVM